MPVGQRHRRGDRRRVDQQGDAGGAASTSFDAAACSAFSFSITLSTSWSSVVFFSGFGAPVEKFEQLREFFQGVNDFRTLAERIHVRL